MIASPDVLDVLRMLVRSALDVEEGVPTTPVALGSVAAADLLAAIGRHRVTDVLRTHSDVLGLPAGISRALDAARQRNRKRLMLQSFETVRALRLLGDRGIDALVFKGQALAVQTTGQADARGAGDIDLLVAQDAVAEAHRALTSSGWALHPCGRVEPEMWAWRHVARWGSALTYLGDGGDVDLHWRFEPIRGAHPELSELWPRREHVEVGGVRVATLGRSDALRHLAGHREGWIWMRTLIDLRRLAREPSVFDGELLAPAAVSLAVARETVGLPAGVPGRVHDQLDRVPVALLERARTGHGLPVTRTFAGGAGSALAFRNNLASSRSLADVGQAAVILVLPAHAALPVRSRTVWTGVPMAFWLRARNFARGVLARIRPGAPCAEQPGRAA